MVRCCGWLIRGSKDKYSLLSIKLTKNLVKCVFIIVNVYQEKNTFIINNKQITVYVLMFVYLKFRIDLIFIQRFIALCLFDVLWFTFVYLEIKADKCCNFILYYFDAMCC